MGKFLVFTFAFFTIAAHGNTVSFTKHGKVQSFLSSVTLTAKMCEDKYKSVNYSDKVSGYCYINVCDKNTPSHFTHKRVFYRFVYGASDDEHVVKILGGRIGQRLDACLLEVSYSNKIATRAAWTDVKPYIAKAFSDLPNGKFEVPVMRIVP